MRIFQRTLFIYPEIQRPLLIQVLVGLTLISIFQACGIYWALNWLASRVEADISIIVDYRVFGFWKNFLYGAIFIPMMINIMVGLYLVLFISNRFAGPIFRLEREIDRYLNHEIDTIAVKFRASDYLHNLAVKVNSIKDRKRS